MNFVNGYDVIFANSRMSRYQLLSLEEHSHFSPADFMESRDISKALSL